MKSHGVLGVAEGQSELAPLTPVEETGRVGHGPRDLRGRFLFGSLFVTGLINIPGQTSGESLFIGGFHPMLLALVNNPQT